MSTRATYAFYQDGQVHTIYIHCDGYFTGAAMYFYNMLVKPSSGNYATQFIRANDGAQLTPSHDYHGDTEYEYDIHVEDGKLSVDVRGRGSYGDYGDIYKFINDNSGLIENYSPFKAVKYGYREFMMNGLTAKDRLVDQLRLLKMWDGKFNGHGNWNTVVANVKALVSAFPFLATTDTELYTSEYKQQLVPYYRYPIAEQ
jgi:hypothetical protein